MAGFIMRQLKNLSNVVKAPLYFDLKLVNVGSFGFFRFRHKQVLRRRASSQLRCEDNSTEVPTAETSLISLPQCVNKSANSSLLSMSPDQELITNENKFKALTTIFRTRSFRERKKTLLLEGPELINIALNVGLQLEHLFYSKEDSLLLLSNYQNLGSVKKYKIRDRTMRELNDNLLSSKVIAVSKQLSLEERYATLKSTLPVTLVCSDIRDPGNLASILTLATATGCKKVLLLKGCVDVWERKVLKSANGAHFDIPIVNNIGWDEILGYFPEGSVFYIADSSSDIDVEDYQFHVDDDNVYQDQTSNEHSTPEFDASKIAIPSERAVQPLDNDEILVCKLYSEISFPKKELFLYIGGETVGINDNAKHLASKLNALKIKLPLANDVDSLNVSVALGIILYEIKRQFMKSINL